MKFEREVLEVKLLNMLKELESDVRIVKQKSDPISHKNKMLLKAKVKIIQNELNKFRKSRRLQKKYKINKFPLTTENMKFERRISTFVKTEIKKAQ